MSLIVDNKEDVLAAFRRWRREHLDARRAGLPGGLATRAPRGAAMIAAVDLFPRSFHLGPLATPKPRSRSHTSAYLTQRMRTLRFLLLARAGRLARLGDRHVLRLSHHPAMGALYATMDHRLAA